MFFALIPYRGMYSIFEGKILKRAFPLVQAVGQSKSDMLTMAKLYQYRLEKSTGPFIKYAQKKAVPSAGTAVFLLHIAIFPLASCSRFCIIV